MKVEIRATGISVRHKYEKIDGHGEKENLNQYLSVCLHIYTHQRELKTSFQHTASTVFLVELVLVKLSPFKKPSSSALIHARHVAEFIT